MAHIKIITGSNRPQRFNPQPVAWIASLLQKRSDVTTSVLDLSEINLPFFDESNPPAMNAYEHEHTKAWSTLVAEADGYIIVTPEYNHSVPAVLKNALDYVYYEWNYKPVGFVSYGSMAGGARAVEHLRGIAGELKLYDIREQVLLPNYWGNLNEEGNYQFSEGEEKVATDMIESVIFWAGQMKVGREALAQSKN